MIRRKPSARWSRWPPAASAFDFTLGNIYFQNEDLTNAVKHFEAALAKFGFRRAQKNPAALVARRQSDAIKALTRSRSAAAMAKCSACSVSPT